MNIPFIDEYNWNELQQAYGTAEHAPSWISDLTSPDEDIRDEAINEFLHSQACHQYTTYSCTPPTVRCVIYILTNYTFEDEDALFNILSFIYACTYNAKTMESLRSEILKGRTCYLAFCNHKNERVKSEAQKLIEYCSEFGVNGS
ncbi:hypothetical protein LJ739_00290 [Aestuariibacter halophilus]|uniref:Immunity protein 30 domain-containing protein n=1 Tax=Fluctibacter halophilus TaxID=226011 RepID=A0ABS8G3I6_9ALTE|nr:hypothetical protein [Aestuariibacter halophilus]MCC2614676.1 hypothetical protein [Aestuariibacter halophilus]